MLEIDVHYNNDIIKFYCGLQAYIFHQGVYRLNEKYQNKADLLDYTSLVYNQVLQDIGRTNVGAFCDFVAEHYEEYKNGVRDREYALNRYYEEAGDEW